MNYLELEKTFERLTEGFYKSTGEEDRLDGMRLSNDLMEEEVDENCLLFYISYFFYKRTFMKPDAWKKKMYDNFLQEFGETIMVKAMRKVVCGMYD